MSLALEISDPLGGPGAEGGKSTCARKEEKVSVSCVQDVEELKSGEW